MVQANRKIQDSIFANLFGDPENQLKIYQFFHPEDKDATVDDIENVTLKAVTINRIYNDLGFIVGDRLMFLIEAQSTWSDNIALRALLYLGDTYKQYLHNTAQDYFIKRAVRLPKPELYVIYTGEEEHTEETINLDTVHWKETSSFVNISVKVLYGTGNDILSQYADFCRTFRAARREYGSTAEAATAAIRRCRERGVLSDYLKEKEAEIVGYTISIFDQEYVTEMHERAIRREVREEVLNETREKVEQAEAKAEQAEAKAEQAEQSAAALESENAELKERIRQLEKLLEK